MLLETEQFVAAFADVGEAQIAAWFALQLEYHARQIRGQSAEARFAFLEHLQRGTVVGTVARIAHLTLDGRQQPFQIIVCEAVVCAGVHCPYDGLVVERVGDDNERQIEAHLLHQLERSRHRQSMWAMLAENCIPGLRLQCGTQLAGTCNPQ